MLTHNSKPRIAAQHAHHNGHQAPFHTHYAFIPYLLLVYHNNHSTTKTTIHVQYESYFNSSPLFFSSFSLPFPPPFFSPFLPLPFLPLLFCSPLFPSLLPQSPKHSGVIPLSGYNKISDAGKSRKYSFKLECGNPNAPIYYLSAESEEELTSWRREIISSVKVLLMLLSPFSMLSSNWNVPIPYYLRIK
jgi:hypothetical protein